MITDYPFSISASKPKAWTLICQDSSISVQKRRNGLQVKLKAAWREGGIKDSLKCDKVVAKPRGYKILAKIRIWNSQSLILMMLICSNLLTHWLNWLYILLRLCLIFHITALMYYWNWKCQLWLWKSRSLKSPGRFICFTARTNFMNIYSPTKHNRVSLTFIYV